MSTPTPTSTTSDRQETAMDRSEHTQHPPLDRPDYLLDPFGVGASRWQQREIPNPIRSVPGLSSVGMRQEPGGSANAARPQRAAGA